MQSILLHQLCLTLATTLVSDVDDSDDEEKWEYVHLLNSTPTINRVQNKFESLELQPSIETRIKPSIDVPPTLELKQLPSHLRYAFLGPFNTLPVIISSALTSMQEYKLLRILREHKLAIGWTLLTFVVLVLPFVCIKSFLKKDINPQWNISGG